MNEGMTSFTAELRHVWRQYRRGDEVIAALADVTVAFPTGALIALVGPSGCGKSTMLNLLAGVDRADEGELIVAGVDLTHATESMLVELRRRKVGMVFQAFHLMPHMTVEENAALPLALAGRPDPERARQLLERVGLSHRSRHFPGELSGGEQQRTAVARALVHKPSLILADEPTGNLDSASGRAVIELLDELRLEENATLVLATHDEAIARRANLHVRLRDGRIEGMS